MEANQQDSREVPVQIPSRRRLSAVRWIFIIAGLLVLTCLIASSGFFVGITVARGPGSAGSGLGPSIGVIRVEGTITEGVSPTTLTGVAASRTIIEQIETANQNPNIKAVVLVVNSPGGGAAASDQIYHALTLLEKPLVVSMGTLAASGGYYISAPADYIFANPNTLTGSIGVISQFFTAEELLEEVGVEVVVITSGDVKDFGSFHREMTEEEITYFQTISDDLYGNFIQVVAEGRGMTNETVREIANGRIYTANQALEIGLIDEIGYFDDAVATAAELSGIEGEPRLIELSPEPTIFDALYGFQSAGDGTISLELIHDITTPSFEYRYIGQ